MVENMMNRRQQQADFNVSKAKRKANEERMKNNQKKIMAAQIRQGSYRFPIEKLIEMRETQGEAKTVETMKQMAKDLPNGWLSKSIDKSAKALSKGLPEWTSSIIYSNIRNTDLKDKMFEQVGFPNVNNVKGVASAVAVKSPDFFIQIRDKVDGSAPMADNDVVSSYGDVPSWVFPQTQVIDKQFVEQLSPQSQETLFSLDPQQTREAVLQAKELAKSQGITPEQAIQAVGAAVSGQLNKSNGLMSEEAKMSTTPSNEIGKAIVSSKNSMNIGGNEMRKSANLLGNPQMDIPMPKGAQTILPVPPMAANYGGKIPNYNMGGQIPSYEWGGDFFGALAGGFNNTNDDERYLREKAELEAYLQKVKQEETPTFRSAVKQPQAPQINNMEGNVLPIGASSYDTLNPELQHVNNRLKLESNTGGAFGPNVQAIGKDIVDQAALAPDAMSDEGLIENSSQNQQVKKQEVAQKLGWAAAADERMKKRMMGSPSVPNPNAMDRRIPKMPGDSVIPGGEQIDTGEAQARESAGYINTALRNARLKEGVNATPPGYGAAAQTAGQEQQAAQKLGFAAAADERMKLGQSGPNANALDRRTVDTPNADALRTNNNVNIDRPEIVKDANWAYGVFQNPNATQADILEAQSIVSPQAQVTQPNAQTSDQRLQNQSPGTFDGYGGYSQQDYVDEAAGINPSGGVNVKSGYGDYSKQDFVDEAQGIVSKPILDLDQVKMFNNNLTSNPVDVANQSERTMSKLPAKKRKEDIDAGVAIATVNGKDVIQVGGSWVTKGDNGSVQTTKPQEIEKINLAFSGNNTGADVVISNGAKKGAFVADFLANNPQATEENASDAYEVQEDQKVVEASLGFTGDVDLATVNTDINDYKVTPKEIAETSTGNSTVDKMITDVTNKSTSVESLMANIEKKIAGLKKEQSAAWNKQMITGLIGFALTRITGGSFAQAMDAATLGMKVGGGDLDFVNKQLAVYEGAQQTGLTGQLDQLIKIQYPEDSELVKNTRDAQRLVATGVWTPQQYNAYLDNLSKVTSGTGTGLTDAKKQAFADEQLRTKAWDINKYNSYLQENLFGGTDKSSSEIYAETFKAPNNDILKVRKDAKIHNLTTGEVMDVLPVGAINITDHRANIPTGIQSNINEISVEARDDANLANQIDNLTAEIDKAGGAEGALGWLKGYTDSFFGSQNATSIWKTKFENIVSQGVIAGLPPGVASDADMRLIRRGFPTKDWDKKALKGWLRGYQSILRYEAGEKEFRAAYMKSNEGDASGANAAWRASSRYQDLTPFKDGNKKTTSGTTSNNVNYTIKY